MKVVIITMWALPSLAWVSVPLRGFGYESFDDEDEVWHIDELTFQSPCGDLVMKET